MSKDVAVVGLGLIGSAALKYLSDQWDAIGIGVAEPADYASHDSVFASHYDNGRLTMRTGADDVWAALNQQAIDQYATIEQQSGISFHQGQGALFVSTDSDNPLPLATNGASIDVTPYETTQAISEDHPMFAFPDGANGRFEPPPAGTINPRQLVQAQLSIAQQNGGEILRDTVTAINKVGSDYEVVCRNGRISARHVLITTGAFTNQLNLPPLHLRVKTETTILVELGTTDVARLANMPVLIYDVKHTTLSGFYMNPPMAYDNGRFYLKIGCDTAGDQWLTSREEMKAWMAHGNTAPYDNQLLDALQQFMPGLSPLSMTPKRCLVTYTSHRKPYIDAIANNLFVAVGGNGKSAKCSDTLGYLASQLVQGEPWPEMCRREVFRIVI